GDRGGEVGGEGVGLEVAGDGGARLAEHVGAIEIDVAVVVHVADGQPHAPEVHRAVGQGAGPKGAVPVVDQQDAVAELVDDVEVRPAVVVGVQPGGGEA